MRQKKAIPIHNSRDLKELTCWRAGLYVSYHQRNINLRAVKQAGFTDIAIRSSIGLAKDPTFSRFYARASALGFRLRVFHFLTQNRTRQMEFWQSIVGRLTFHGYFLDMARPNLTVDKMRLALLAADDRLGRRVGVYINKRMANKLPDAAPWLAGRELWYAAWQDDFFNTPIPPAPWGELRYWQVKKIKVGGAITWLDLYH